MLSTYLCANPLPDSTSRSASKSFSKLYNPSNTVSDCSEKLKVKLRSNLENRIYRPSFESRLRSGTLRGRNGLLLSWLNALRSWSRGSTTFSATRTRYGWGDCSAAHLLLQRHWRVFESWLLREHRVRYSGNERESPSETRHRPPN